SIALARARIAGIVNGAAIAKVHPHRRSQLIVRRNETCRARYPLPVSHLVLRLILRQSPPRLPLQRGLMLCANTNSTLRCRMAQGCAPGESVALHFAVVHG